MNLDKEHRSIDSFRREDRNSLPIHILYIFAAGLHSKKEQKIIDGQVRSGPCRCLEENRPVQKVVGAFDPIQHEEGKQREAAFFSVVYSKKMSKSGRQAEKDDGSKHWSRSVTCVVNW